MLRSRQSLLTIAACSCLAVVTACGRRIDPREREAPTAGTAARHLQRSSDEPQPPQARDSARPVFRHVDARDLFASIRGQKLKGAVLNVWATWCGPCQDELPMLAKVAKAYRSRGISVIPLSVDDPADEPKIPKQLSELGFEPPYYVVRGDIDAMKSALYPGWPGNIPVSFILDGSAARRYFFNAEVYEQELVPKLDAFLDGTLAEGKSSFGVAPGQEL